MQQFYDVIVIGAGHAGCEAAHAAARLGAHVCLVTMDMNKIAQMSCNPAVGGIAKGQIVREIDALGGGMGIVTDASAIQFRMLNKSKGPAMWSPRAQCDRGKFIWNWRTLLDNTPNLDIWQDQVTELLVEAQSEELRVKSEKFGNDLSNKADSSSIATDKSNSNSSIFTLQSSLNQPRQRVIGCKTIWGCELIAPAVVVTAGTFLNGLMHVGRKMVPGGRCAEPAALHLTESLNALGITSQRMKTGTPVRIDKRSVHFEDTEIQPGENVAQLFSYLHRDNFAKEGLTSVVGARTLTSFAGTGTLTSVVGAGTLKNLGGNSHPLPIEGELSEGLRGSLLPQLPCWTFNTNEECHKELLKGLEDSPLYNGQIQSIGPRYCPSVETKLVTFPDRTQHPLFLEPEGTDTNEMYLNGFSSSMPMDVQINALKKIPALRDIRIYRPGYAIEYDFFDPTQLDHSLMNKLHPGLFFAGQVNGTTGYEEAGGQGIVAGINAARYAGSLGSDVAFDPFVLNRDEAYIGVLIDDLVMKGVDEPYRMFTSRAEYRILLRQDDADTRLTPRSYDLGLASSQRYDLWKKKRDGIESIKSYALSTNVSPKDANAYLESIGSTPLQHGCKLSELIARPGVTISGLSEVLPSFKETIAAAGGIDNCEISDCAEIEVKYDGYIRRERETAEKMHRLENIKISGHFDYNSIQGLSTEARQKLTARKPETLAQASRIPGISPADINVLLVLMGR